MQKERNLGLIKNLLKVAKSEKILNAIYLNDSYNDEPKLFSFSSVLKIKNQSINKSSLDNIITGVSFIKETALLKTLGEALERYNLSIYQEKNFIWNSYNSLKGKRIDPQKFISFSKKDFHAKPKFNLYTSKNDELNWMKGFSLTKKEEILIPAQLVFVPYYFTTKEPVIRFPITTGAACYNSLKGAILRGLLEVIERDAFMIFYLNKLSPPIINIQNSQDKLLEKIFSSIKRYKLELYILDISTDVPVYSILAIVIDKTGFGPAISLGMKSDLYIKNAIIGAIEESFHSRFWIKDIMIQKKIKSLWMEIQKKKDYISDLKERGIIWSELQMINKINFFFKGKKVLLKKTSSTKTENLDSLLKWFTKQNIEVLYVNITPARLEREKIYVVKVIIPQFQPLYLDERFPYWEGKRLKEIPQKLGLKPLKKVYKFPHPFL
jgi:ribosomal protein S12 methylthiotransferase accessory factor